MGNRSGYQSGGVFYRATGEELGKYKDIKFAKSDYEKQKKIFESGERERETKKEN